MRSRSYCFTWFGDEPPVFEGKCTYLITGAETCPETGRKHWQSYAEFSDAATISAAQKILKVPGAHMEKRRGTPQQAADYCKKDGDFMEFGERSRQGERVDLAQAVDVIRSKRRWADVVNDPELFQVVKQNGRWAKEIFDNKPKQPRAALEWRPWQATLLAELREPAHPRKIVWYVDYDGGAGKTELTKYVLTNMSAIVLSGKMADILHAYDMQDVAIFDFPREAQEFVNYGAIEKIKDGCYHSGKYEGKVVVRDFDAHVVVFANFHPKEEKLSADRWDIREL